MKLENVIYERFPRLRGEKYSVFFCVDDAIATCAKYINVPYEMMYFDALKIRYINSEEKERVSIGEKVVTENLFEGNSFANNLKEYTGMTLKEYSNNNKEEIIDIVKTKIENKMPVILLMDAYWCPWDWRYKEIKNGGHALIINGINFEKKTLYCIDPYYQKSNLSLEFEMFLQGCTNIVTIQYESLNKQINVIDILLEKISVSSRKDTMDDMLNLAQDITNNFKIENEILNYSSEEKISLDELKNRIPLIESFLKISNNLQRFAVLLKYIMNERLFVENELVILIDKLIYISEKWDMMRYMLLKQVVLNQTEDISIFIPKKILSVCEEENEILNQIEKLINGNAISNKASYEYRFFNGEKNLKIVPIDLVYYFNNEGSGCINSESADFNDLNEYFLIDDVFEKGFIEWENIKFILGRNKEKKNNIRCLGQTIQIPEDQYNYIYILGCTEWGDYSDDIIVTFSDGSSKKYKISFLDWTPSLELGEPTNTVYSGKGIKRTNSRFIESDIPHRLYGKKLYIDSNDKIKYITLPNVITMHIFAMSLT